MSLDVVVACEGAIYAINREGDDKPNKHHGPVALDGFQHGEHGEDGACGCEEMNREGFGLKCHVLLLADLG